MTRETEQKLAEIISDEEIANFHRGDFGGMTPRNVVNDGVRKAALGYHSGHTQFSILRAHGLITAPRGMNPDYNLTKKGKKYARALLHSAMFPAAPPAPSGWRSMESAPKDGTHVDVWAVVRTTQEGIPDRGKRYENAAFVEADGAWLDQWGNRIDWADEAPDEDGHVSGRYVTRWMPLPEAPGDGQRIIDGLRDVVAGNVTVRAAPSPDTGKMGGEGDAVILLQARYVLKDLHAKDPNCGYGKMADACERAAAPVPGGEGEAVAWLDGLEKLADAAAKRAPGLWGSDIEKGTGEYGEGEDPRTGFMVPYMETEHGKRLFDAHFCDVAEVHEEYDEDGVYAWDEAAREIFNFLAAVQPKEVKRLIAMARAHPSDPSATERMRAEAREAITTLAMLKRNVNTEIAKYDGLFRWEGVPEAIQSRIDALSAALGEA